MSPDAKRAVQEDHNSAVGPVGHGRSDVWLNELPPLLWLYCGLGIVQDVGQMNLADLRGVYHYLSRMQRSSHTEPNATH